MKLSIDKNGNILKIDTDEFSIPFRREYGFCYVKDEVVYKIDLKKEEDKFITVQNGIKYTLYYEEMGNYAVIHMRIENTSKYDFSPELLIFDLGVDSYMETYPSWNNKFFPTLIRCEKSHLYGYFMNTNKQSLGIITSNPVSSYDYTYTSIEGVRDLGHRITGQRLHIINHTDMKMARSRALKTLKHGEIYENKIYLVPMNSDADILENLSNIGNVPMIKGDKFTYDIGEKLNINIISRDRYNAYIISPKGDIMNYDNFTFNDYGLYTLKVETASKKISEAKLYCKKDWKFYLKNAAKEAIRKPQKATTHTESWYGLFSLFLAAKRFHDKAIFDKAMDCFNEIMPYMFDFEKCEPKVSPSRIQNTSALVSLLTDIYECDEKENLKYLYLASRFADFLIENQKEDGAYYNRNTHYTCVIYIAKSILELSIAEKKSDDAFLNEKGERHYNSIKLAINDLALKLDNIQTEGEQTLEDGMISCSALQMGMFALTLPVNLREKYINAAEYMIRIHNCLEQNLIPDCRMRGASLRFWEGQYDVMIRANFFSSPHGWSAWTGYAYYYLYMLTGKREYLVHFMNVMSACIQLMDENGNLSWAFCAQPYVKAEALVKDKAIKNCGYAFSKELGNSFSGKYTILEFGEGYLPMISDWYRITENKLVGGYEFCPLFIDEDKYIIDNTGGCCDNDVHEIFKCMEETVNNKAFIYENDDGTFLTYGLNVISDHGFIKIDFMNKESVLCYNLKSEKQIICNEKHLSLSGFGLQEF